MALEDPEFQIRPFRCLKGTAARGCSLSPLRRIGQGVLEVVGMLAFGDVDGHLAGEADELAGANENWGQMKTGDRRVECTPKLRHGKW